MLGLIMALISEIVFFRLRRPRPPLRFAFSSKACCSAMASSKYFRMASDVTWSLVPCRMTKPAPIASLTFSFINSSRARIAFVSSNRREASKTDTRMLRWARYNSRFTASALIFASSSLIAPSRSGRVNARLVSTPNSALPEFSSSTGDSARSGSGCSDSRDLDLLRVTIWGFCTVKGIAFSTILACSALGFLALGAGAVPHVAFACAEGGVNEAFGLPDLRAPKEPSESYIFATLRFGKDFWLVACTMKRAFCSLVFNESSEPVRFRPISFRSTEVSSSIIGAGGGTAIISAGSSVKVTWLSE
mmetsp:Transcript_11797/g.29900  ORF Transcript_11797/g.29900 Transcript_11797/m.29900 type:complete len:304 (+) Transcript_11797:432-1343(+)